ncbi:MAG TPA: FMN-binding protein [Chitinivibrionales bacterium]|nr:FMN-binding protein [Chitinivibrionales bacterium]
MKKVLKITGIVAGVLLALMVIGAFVGSIGMGEIKKLTIANVDLSQKADGVYRGSYHKGRWNYDVEVAVAGHKIIGIKQTNPAMRATKGLTDKIAAKIIEKQAEKIDAVSGASVNTMAMCKAVEIALNQGAVVK